MQRYKQYVMAKYGSYLGFNLVYDRNILYPAQIPIEADNYGKYAGYRRTVNTMHADYLNVATLCRIQRAKGGPYSLVMDARQALATCTVIRPSYMFGLVP